MSRPVHGKRSARVLNGVQTSRRSPYPNPASSTSSSPPSRSTTRSSSPRSSCRAAANKSSSAPTARWATGDTTMSRAQPASNSITQRRRVSLPTPPKVVPADPGETESERGPKLRSGRRPSRPGVRPLAIQTGRSGPQGLTGRHRKSTLKSISAHVKEHYPDAAYGAYPIENNSKVAIIIVANKYSPNNYW